MGLNVPAGGGVPLTNPLPLTLSVGDLAGTIDAPFSVRGRNLKYP